MSQFIDRRLNGKNKSTVNRQRFIRRYKNQIKKAVSDAVAERSITDIDKGERIVISDKDLQEPRLTHGSGGIVESIHPGNVEFITGDRVQRPPSAAEAQGSQASNKGEGEDEFVFDVSREEFLDLYFEDLALPDLVKKQITVIPDYKLKRAGVSNSGTPTNINVIRSMRQAMGRRIALRAPYKKELEAIEAQLALIDPDTDHKNYVALLDQMEFFKKKIAKVPFIDTIDLRYNYHVKQPSPSTQAVMFCLMDVSGSMDEVKKDIAKRFFILLYLFLNRNYEKIELVFIRHHTSAKEVSEEEFFYSRETGGTVVSSALELMKTVIHERYPANSWNIYAAQASDGDNWNADSPHCQKLLTQYVMPFVQYYAYIEIMPRHHQSLWEAYLTVRDAYPNFAMQNINDLNDIYPIFRELFKKETV